MSRSIAPDALKVVLQHPESLTLLDVRRRGDCDADTVMLPGARWYAPEHISAWSQGLPTRKRSCSLAPTAEPSVTPRWMTDSPRASGRDVLRVASLPGKKQAGKPCRNPRDTRESLRATVALCSVGGVRMRPVLKALRGAGIHGEARHPPRRMAVPCVVCLYSWGHGSTRDRA